MPGKHSPNRWRSYIQIHETVMHKFKCDGFVICERLLITPLRKAILIEGTIDCSGGLKIDVQKRLDILEQEYRNPLVQTGSYSYNVFMNGVGNVFRYDSPHKDHNRQHHVHRYDVLNAGNTVAVTYIEDEVNIPTLGEVIEEAKTWYYAHLEFLPA